MEVLIRRDLGSPLPSFLSFVRSAAERHGEASEIPCDNEADENEDNFQADLSRHIFGKDGLRNALGSPEMNELVHGCDGQGQDEYGKYQERCRIYFQAA